MALGPAQRLDDVYLTISTEPLMDDAEFEAFYVGDVNSARGLDDIRRLALKLRQASGKKFCKAFLVGHSGVGKSTELTRLQLEMPAVAERYKFIRFKATEEFNPAGLNPFDVVLLMMDEVVRKTREGGDEDGGHLEVILEDIWAWFSDEETIRTTTRSASGQAEVGLEAQTPPLLDRVMKLFARMRGEMKYAVESSTRSIDYTSRRISELIELCNRLIYNCNNILKTRENKEWLFVGEDFDKSSIDAARIEDLFIKKAVIFQQLQTHFIFTLPIELYYSEKEAKLPLGMDQVFNVHDIAVFDQDHAPNPEGREAVKRLVAARVSLDVFEPGVLDAIIEASGGNLRDLFEVIGLAADLALLDEDESIPMATAEHAINELRVKYRNRLGSGMEEENIIPYDVKADLLVRVYRGEQKADIPERAMFQLLRARAIQEFNGKRWFGVHPMVVDLLRRQGYDLDA